MRCEVKIGDRVRTVEVRRKGGIYSVRVDGKEYRVDAHRPDRSFYSFLVGPDSYDLGVYSEGNRYTVEVEGRRYRFDFLEPGFGKSAGKSAGGAVSGPQEVLAVMAGRVVTVLVREGDKVKAGQGLIILEAMKMENEVQAPKAGTVSVIHVSKGQSLERGAPIATVE